MFLNVSGYAVESAVGADEIYPKVVNIIHYLQIPL
jgi:hypothetical protein